MDHAADGFQSAPVVERTQNEMPCFRRSERRCYGFPVPHFPYGNDIGVFPKRFADAFGKTYRVTADFSLADKGFPRGKDILHRIFQSHDVTRFFLTDLFQHSCHGSAFPASCRA